MTDTLIIYHAKCADGFAAAWIAHRRHPDAQALPFHYGDPPPDVRGKRVYILDFSFDRETLIRMHDEAEYLLVLDHHKAAQAALGDLDFAVFDLDRSGAMLAWDHFFPGEPAPLLVQYVQDRDLWQWRMPHSKEINAYIATLPHTWTAWTAASYTEFELLRVKGEVALRVVDKYVEDKRTDVAWVRPAGMQGVPIPIVNTTFAISELVGELAEAVPFAAGWFQRADERYAVSLRSRGEDGADVSQIAKRFGGGGHKNAAGFTCLRHPHAVLEQGTK